MEEIIALMKRKAKEKECSVWEVYEELEGFLGNTQQELEAEETHEAILKDASEYSFHYIEKDALENIWSSEEEELVPDEEGYVYIKPFLHYSDLDVIKGNLIPIQWKDVVALAKEIKWNEDLAFIEYPESYHTLAKEIIEKRKNQE